MRVIVETSKSFNREVKRFARHYASFLHDLRNFEEELKQNPQLGTDLGNNIRKIRMQVTSKGKGKSGGMRVISVNVYASVTETTINLLYIYDKKEKSTIKKQEIVALMRQNGLL